MDKRLFAKLNSEGELIIAPHHYEDDDTYIMNFDECEELMFIYGFKPIRGKEPEYNRETQNLIINYVEEDTCIRKVCEVIEKVTPQFEVNSIDEEPEEIIEKSVITHSVDIQKENEELKQRVEDLERKQQELLNLLNSFISECSTSMNKINNMEDNMISMKISIKKFNKFIDLYNSTKRD